MESNRQLPAEGEIGRLLQNSRVVVAAETFNFVSLSHSEFSRLLQNAALSPRGSAPYFIFSDRFEVTLMLDDVDFLKIRDAVTNASIERGFRLLTFDIELDFTVTGFLAFVTRILSEAAVPVVAVSAFSRDHLLVRQADLATALKALGPYVAELC